VCKKRVISEFKIPNITSEIPEESVGASTGTNAIMGAEFRAGKKGWGWLSASG